MSNIFHSSKLYIKGYSPAFDDPPADPTNPAPKGDGGGEPKGDTIKKDDLDRMLAENSRKHQQVVDGLKAELDALSKRSNLSAKDREDLEQRVNELNNKLLTKEEMAKQEKDKLLKQHQSERENLESEAKAWRGRYESTRIVSSLSDAAAKHKAYNPQQVVTMLRGETRLVEVEKDGQGTGDFEVRVKLNSKDSKGQPVQLDLAPDEAVKHMSEQDEYLNLFTADGSPGTGSRKSKDNLDPTELAKDPAAYRQARKEGRI